MFSKKSLSSYNNRPYTLVGTCVVGLSLPIVQQRDLINCHQFNGTIHQSCTIWSVSAYIPGACQSILTMFA